MNSKIQQLTETIYNEGVQKAREDADAIIKEAKEKAASIEREAKKKSDRIMKETEEKSQELESQVNSEIKMSLNQAVSAIKQEITRLITLQVIKPPVHELFSDEEYLKSLISEIVEGWMEKESIDLTIIMPESKKEQLETFFKNNLADEMNKGLSVTFSNKLKSGFKIGPSDGSYIISFTDEDFINFLKGYLRPKTGEILFGEEK